MTQSHTKKNCPCKDAYIVCIKQRIHRICNHIENQCLQHFRNSSRRSDIAGAFREHKIKLKYKEVILEYKEEFDFKRVIDTFEDDKDSYDDLLKSLKIDSKVDNTKAGKYEVIFTVTDSEGKSGSITLPVTVKEEVKVENHEEYYEPIYNEPNNNPPQDNNPEPTPPPVINTPEPSESPIPSESPAPPESENPEGDNQPNESPDVPPVDNGSSGSEIE